MVQSDCQDTYDYLFEFACVTGKTATLLRSTSGEYQNPHKSLTILARKDNTSIILACGLLYVVYICVTASLSVLFIDIYGLNQWQAGLIYLPFGLGGTVSTLFPGSRPRCQDKASSLN